MVTDATAAFSLDGIKAAATNAQMFAREHRNLNPGHVESEININRAFKRIQDKT